MQGLRCRGSFVDPSFPQEPEKENYFAEIEERYKQAFLTVEAS
jgi:hypothetical protein